MQTQATVTPFKRVYESLLEEVLDDLNRKGYKTGNIQLKKMGEERLREKGWKDAYFVITNNIFATQTNQQHTLSIYIFREPDGPWYQIHEIWT